MFGLILKINLIKCNKHESSPCQVQVILIMFIPFQTPTNSLIYLSALSMNCNVFYDKKNTRRFLQNTNLLCDSRVNAYLNYTVA